MNTARTDRLLNAAQALVALLACVLAAYACTRYGPAVDNDTADFFSAADSLVSGGGFSMTTGRLFILWPPLHPLLLAALGGLGLEHVDASLLINLVALFVTLWVGARLVTRLSSSPALGLLWCLVVAVAPDFFWIHTRALSEAPFMAFCTLAISGCSAYLEQPRARHFAWMTIGAGLAWVERYAGMVLLPVLGACLLFAPGSASRLHRLRRSVVFGILAGLPMLPWVLRNLIHTRQFTGDRGSFGEFGIPAVQALAQSTRTIGAWFVPHSSPLLVGLALVALVAVAAGCTLAAAPSRRPGALGWLPLISFPLVYFAFTDVININYEIDGLGPRQMLPALPTVWAVVLLAGQRAHAGWHCRRRALARPATFAMLLLIGAYFTVTVPSTLGHAQRLHRDGAGFYSAARWHESALLLAAGEVPVEAELTSNDVYAVYLFIGLRSSPLPARPFRYGLLARRLAAEQRSLQVIWVRTNERNRLPVERMQEHVIITTLLETADGAVYRLDPR